MTDATRIRAQLQGDKVTVSALLSHEMESGQRHDPAGKLVPAWFIQNVQATCNGRLVMNAYWGPAVSKNPYVQFSFKGGKAGDTIRLTWTDNRGVRRMDEALVAAA